MVPTYKGIILTACMSQSVLVTNESMRTPQRDVRAHQRIACPASPFHDLVANQAFNICCANDANDVLLSVPAAACVCHSRSAKAMQGWYQLKTTRF
jgi:hypothetical protein